MNGSKIKAVIDTNVIFMSIYNPESKSKQVIKAAIEDKIKLFSTDTVQEEIKRLLYKELSFSKDQIDFEIGALPITWIKKEIYQDFLPKTKVKHKADKPIEALSLVIGCGIFSADYHFKDRININEFLKEIE